LLITLNSGRRLQQVMVADANGEDCFTDSRRQLRIYLKKFSNDTKLRVILLQQPRSLFDHLRPRCGRSCCSASCISVYISVRQRT